MSLQNFEIKNRAIRQHFLELKRTRPERLERRLEMSWSVWGFGTEGLETSARRLRQAGLSFVELPADRFGPDLGYRAEETRSVLEDHELRLSGLCGLFSPDNDLSSNRGAVSVSSMSGVTGVRSPNVFHSNTMPSLSSSTFWIHGSISSM